MISPRVDPGANLRYLDFVCAPLNDVRAETVALDGRSPARISTRQWSIMSSWMVVQRATAAAFENVFEPVHRYRDRWLELVTSGVPDDVLDGPATDLAERAARDLRNCAAVFNPAIDPVWLQVDRTLGPEMSGGVQDLLQNPGAR